jgi:hypothetical protein
MLAPMLTNKRLRTRLFKSNKRPGASLVATTLFNDCILDVCTLLLDDEQNWISPSVRRLVKPFLPEERKKTHRPVKMMKLELFGSRDPPSR